MKIITLVLSFLLAFGAGAQELRPDELVRKVTADVLESIKIDEQLQGGDRKKALALAEQKILPHIDFREAAQLAMGRSWYTATPAQQKQVIDEFRALLVRIYSSSIDVYRSQTLKVLPVRMAPGATEVTVRNQYLSPGRQPIPVAYAMKKTPEGWKIYDISVEGVSLVLTYRAEFESITRASGVEGLIKRLREKNA